MKARILSTLGLWLGIIALIALLGSPGAVWLIALISARTQYELYELWEKIGLKPIKLWGSVLGSVCLLVAYYLPTAPGFDGGLAVFGISVVLLAAYTLNHPTQYHFRDTVLPTIAGTVIVPFAFYFLINLVKFYENLNQPWVGLFMGIWVIAVTKFTDVGGLLVGRKLGRRKLAPAISPGKTWEGVAGGLVVSVVVGIGLVLGFPEYYPADFTPLLAGLIALPIAVAGIASDLLESVFKRMAGVKDSGALIPGIGGTYDLTDSLLLSAPVAYCLIKLTVL